MRGGSRATRVAVAAGLIAGSALLPATAAAPAGAEPLPPAAAPSTPDTMACPYRVSPAPAVDTSEVPPSGQQAPAALPVPRPPVGGEKLAACGVVAAGDSSSVPRGLTSAGWLVADATDGTVLAAKDPHGRYRPASTIKTLLALVALRDLDLDTVVTGTREDYGMEGDSAGIGPGGQYTVRQLLQGLLMVSGNDCANALARQLGGYEAAVGKMNDLARSLGAQDTRATSPSGLDAPGMSTSPYDLALVFRAALANSTFRDLISRVDAPFPGYPPLPEVPGDKPHAGYQMQSQNRLLTDGFPGAVGGKTGYTDDARKTYVGAVERNGRTIVVVQMYGLNEPGDSYWDQAKALVEYGFAIPRTASVGTLVDGPASSSGGGTSSDGRTSTARTNSGPLLAQPASDEGPGDGGVSTRLVVGGIGVLVVLGLVLAAVRINRRTR